MRPVGNPARARHYILTMAFVLFAAAAAGGEPAETDPVDPIPARPYPHARVKVALPLNGSGQIREELMSPTPVPAPSPAPAPAPEAASHLRPEVNESVSADAAPDQGRVLAILDGRTITEEDVLRELWETRGKETLDWMIGRVILQNELTRLKLEITDAEVDERLAKHLEDLGKAFPNIRDPDALTRTAAGMRLKEYRDRSVWTELALRKILRNSLPPSEEQLRGYFAECRGTFIQPERVKITQLFIAPRPNPANDGAPAAEDWARAEQEIVEAHSRLRMGEDFRSIASAYPSASFHTRWVERGELLRELEDTAFQLRPGSLSAPLKSPLGYHIIRTEDKRESRTPEFAEVREQVQERYEEARFVAKAGEFLSVMRDKALRSGSLVVADAPVFSGAGLFGQR